MRLTIFALVFFFSKNIFSQKPLSGADVCAENKRLTLRNPPSGTDSRSDSIDLQLTIIGLDLSDMDNQQIRGFCAQNFSTRVDGVPEIRLDLQALTVDSVFLDAKKVAFTHQNNAVRVVFPQAKNAGEEGHVRVFYHGKPPVGAWGGFYFQNGYAYNIGVGIGVEPPSFGRAWFPCFDNFVERSQYFIQITSPKGRPGYANGRLVVDESLPDGRHDRIWNLEEEIPSYLACAAAGPFASFRREIVGEEGQIPVEIAVAPGDSVKLRNSFVHLPEAVAAFEHWFGPYRWPKVGYSVVPFTGGAMEHATNIAYPRFAVEGTTASETLMAHELSHHWWGDLATCSEPSEMWLNEGWASYCEHLFTEYVYGNQAFISAVDANHLSVLQNTHVREGGYRAVSGVPAEYTYGEHVYSKGAVVAHNLRGYLGDSLFRVGCRAAMAGTNFDDWNSAEFRDKLTTATGVDMTDFFNDWVFSPGYADFTVDSFRTSPAATTVFVKQKLRGAPHLHQNVPLEFTFLGPGGQRKTLIAKVSGENSEAMFYLPFAPVQVFLNTGHRLNLARADNEKWVKTTGQHLFPQAKLNLQVDKITDSAFVRIEHHFAMPDTAGSANPHNYLLTNRFWSVRGHFPADFEPIGNFFYDGRGKLDQLDAELFRNTSPKEDSVLLLYRPGAGHPWEECTDCKKTMLSPTDKFGYVRVTRVRPGDYTFGKGASTVPTAEAVEQFFSKIAPNPASREVQISADENFHKLLIFNTLGDVVRSLEFEKTKLKTLPVGDLEAGVYWMLLQGEGRASVVSFQKI